MNINYDQTSHFDIYGSDTTPLSPLIIFVHGGAWRSEDKADHAGTAQRIAQLSGCAVAVPNYRLSSTEGSAIHPEHTEDILRFFGFIRSWRESPVPFDPDRLYLIGHSCSAHMLCSILLDSSHVTPSLTPDPALVLSVQGVILTEGIYDLDLLLESFPKYKAWFVSDAFGDMLDYAPYSILRYPPRDPRIRWLIIHSKADTLIDRKQSDAAIVHIGATCQVTANMDSFNVEHDDILREEAYIKLVVDFVKEQ